VDARRPAVQALDRLPAAVRRHRPLPHLRHRRHLRTLAGGYVRRPTLPPQSPTLGLTHLQFDALLTDARQSCNPFDFALACQLGLLGRRIFETVGADAEDRRSGQRQE